MKRRLRLVEGIIVGLTVVFVVAACGHRRSAPVNFYGAGAAHAERFPIDLGRTPVAGSKFRVRLASTTRRVTHADVDGEQQKQSDEREIVEVEAVGDVLASTARGITRANYTIKRLLVDGKEALAPDTVITFDRDAVEMLKVGEQPVAASAGPALMLMITGLEPLNDDAMVGLARKQSVGATWKVDALSAAVQFESAGIRVDPDQIHGRSHFAALTELDGTPSMTVQSELELRGARPKRPAPGTDVLPSSYAVKSEITVPLGVKIATLRDERSRTHSVVKVRTLDDKRQPQINLTVTTTANQALRLRPIGEVKEDGVDEGPILDEPKQDDGFDELQNAPPAPPKKTAPDDGWNDADDGPIPSPTWQPGRGLESGYPEQ
jgi:hypothetical protein